MQPPLIRVDYGRFKLFVQLLQLGGLDRLGIAGMLRFGCQFRRFGTVRQLQRGERRTAHWRPREVEDGDRDVESFIDISAYQQAILEYPYSAARFQFEEAASKWELQRQIPQERSRIWCPFGP